MSDPCGLALLDAILRVASGLGVALASAAPAHGQSAAAGPAPVLAVDRYAGTGLDMRPAWCSTPLRPGEVDDANGLQAGGSSEQKVKDQAAATWRAKFSVAK